MTEISPSELLAVAEEAARAAGQHALENIARRTEADSRSRYDVKLVLDRECQAVATEVLQAHYPAHDVMGEEAGELASGTGFQWVIDPIDGTVNFSRGHAYWCSSVAVQQGGRTLAGVVYAPALDTCYTAALDGPACCNGTPIRVSSTERLEDAMVLTNFTGCTGRDDARTRVLWRLMPAVGKIRILGASALDLCLVAAGSVDALCEYSLSLWDYAAAGLIVERAGGRFEESLLPPDGTRRCVATNGHLYGTLTDLLDGRHA